MKRFYLWLPLAPWIVWAIGIATNVLVMTANHGMMPYQWTPRSGDDDMYHVLWTHATHLKVLADWVTIPALGGILSPGDLLIYAGDALKIPLAIFWAGMLWGRYGD